ncbi:MAG: PAS domain S-box protein [Chlorobiales bacterium]
MSIRILHFDTSLLDAQLVWLTLKSDELQPEIEHVESFEEFEEALEEQTYDLVLCEYALHKRKTASDVIAYLKSKSIPIPVIVFSKITDEAIVAEVLKKGAADYVFKSQLNFLAAAIKEVLSRKPAATPQMQDLQPSEDFMKNLEAIRAQLAQLQSSFLEDEPHPAPTTKKEPHEPALFNMPNYADSSPVIDEMQKKIDELTDTVAALNANNFDLQNALDQARAQLQSLQVNASIDTNLETQLEAARQALNELTDALKNAEEKANLAAIAYEEERQANIRLKAELSEKAEREKELMNEVDKAQEAEMQLRIELQDALITGNQLRDAVESAGNQLAQFEAMFKQYDAALNEQVSNAGALSEQIETAKAELANAEEEKQSLESKLAAVQESAQSLAQRFTKELAELRAKLDEEIRKRQSLEQELSQANQTIQTLSAQPKGNPEKEAQLEAQLAEAQNTISQLRADWEQADREVERLESDVKILESSVLEKSAKLQKAQKELKTKERMLKEKSAILDALNLAIVIVSVSGEIRYWNEAAAVFHGVPAGEALGKKSDEIMKYKYASSKERKAAMESLQSVGRWDGKIKYLTPDGEQKTAEMFISRLDDEVGNPLGVLTLLTDVTKRATIESEHWEFKQHIEPMLNALPVSIITFDDAGIITGIFGKSAADQHQSASALAKGKSIYEIYGKHPSLLVAFRQVLSGESVATSLTVAESQVDFHFSPMISNGVIVGAVGVLIEARSPALQA